MALPSTGNSNLGFGLVEKAVLNDGGIANENDSGVFSETTTVNSQLPIYFKRHGNNSSKSSRYLNVFSCDQWRRGRFAMSYTPVRRLIRKSGKANVIRTHIPQLLAAYIRDLGNTLVNGRWRWTILSFASSYLLSWLLFAWFYLLIARDNNDVSSESPSETPCLQGISGFAGYFLFSLETQHTIGYGTRYITSNCPEGTFLISLQMIMGVAICGGMASIVYTKMVRPRSPPSKALFSRNAVICQRDGVLCLVFRVRDKDSKHRVGTKIKAYLVQSRADEPHLKTLTLENPGLLLWPLEVVHPITPSSPFWDLSAKDLITRGFELVVTLQGVSVTTGQCSKTHTSYLSPEILWGHRFKPCVKFDYDKQAYYVDSADFNTTEEVLTPLCSAQRLYEVVQEINSAMYGPIAVKSPTTTRSWRLRSDDDTSLGDSSGIESLREDLLSPLLSNNSALRKLSTIREFASVENVKIGGNPNREFMSMENLKTVHPLEVDDAVGDVDGRISSDSSVEDTAKWNTEVDRYLVDMDEQFPKLNARVANRNSEVFDVESLVTSLQNYLMETEEVERAKPKQFYETNF